MSKLLYSEINNDYLLSAGGGAMGDFHFLLHAFLCFPNEQYVGHIK